MAKIELIKELQPKGEIYYYVYVDGKRISDTCTYGGNISNDTQQYMDAQLEKANQVYDNIVTGRTSAAKVLTIIKSENI